MQLYENLYYQSHELWWKNQFVLSLFFIIIIIFYLSANDNDVITTVIRNREWTILRCIQIYGLLMSYFSEHKKPFGNSLPFAYLAKTTLKLEVLVGYLEDATFSITNQTSRNNSFNLSIASSPIVTGVVIFVDSLLLCLW